MKKLQQQVSRLRTQYQKRTDRVVELQVEVEILTGIIYLVHYKVQQSLGSIGMKNSEHFSSELVEKLNTVKAEVRQET